jgi:hypothetical protein
MYEHRDRQINEVANKENLSSRQHNKRMKLSNKIYRQTHRQTDRQTDRQINKVSNKADSFS